MKPDVSIDYYGLLGVQPNATDDEIKKAFRKQALLHHPDRNPGKEEQAKAKFQDMQAAHDTLSTPAKRTRYDQERLKQGMLWQKRPSAAPQARTQQPFFRQSQPPPQPATKPANQSRYADYTQASRDSSPFGGDVNTKFEAWKAFEQMRGTRKPASPPKGSPTKPRPAPTAQKSRSRSDWDEAQFPESPRTPRSQATRTPRRPGFNPYAEDGDDTSSRNTSAFYNVARGGRPQASYPRPADNLFAQANARSNAGTRSPGVGTNSGNDDAFANERLSTPYANQSGEKTYFSSAGINRSASTAANLHKLNAERAKASPGLGSGRFRSASPRARSPRPAYEDDTSPCTSEDESFADSMKESQQSYYTRRGSADPRAHAPKVTVKDEADEPQNFAMPKRQQTWGSEQLAENDSSRVHYFPSSPASQTASNTNHQDTTPRQTRPNLQRDSTVPQSRPEGNDFAARTTTATNEQAGTGKKPSLYENPKFPFARSFAGSQSEENGASQTQKAPLKATRSWPYWAIPSSIFVSPAIVSGAQNKVDPFSKQAGRSPKPANSGDHYSSFSKPSSSSGSGSPLKNASAENVNTQFSPTDWPGQFFGSSSNVASQPATSSRTNARTRSSPPKRPTLSSMFTSPSKTPYGASTDANATTEKNSTAPVQDPPPAKFSSQEWNKHFKESTFSGRPPPTRPIATPRSRNAKRSAQAAQPTGSGQSTNAFVISDDTGDEGDDEGRQSGSNIGTDPDLSRATSASAMDIDSTPPATTVPSSSSAGPTAPTSNTMSPPPAFTTFPKPPPPSTAFNMQPLNATFPMAGSSSAGLSDLKSDLGTTLPFESEAGARPGAQPKAQQLNLPRLPKQPLPPGRLTSSSFAMYMNQVATYMREFHAFNSQMVDHFRGRQARMEQMTQQTTAQADKGFVPMVNGIGGGAFGSSGVGGLGGANLADTANWSWMGARGDEGYLQYMAWMEEDDRIRVHFSIARERHREALEKLGQVRRQMIEIVDHGRHS